MRSGKKIILISFLVVSTFLLTGCVPKLNTTGGGVKSEEFAKGKVVRGFPQDLPLYKGAVVIESYGGVSGYGASFITDDSLNKVVNFYNLGLAQLGWTVEVKKQSDTNFIFEIKNDKNQGRVIVNTAADGKKTAITVTISGR